MPLELLVFQTISGDAEFVPLGSDAILAPRPRIA